MIRTFLLGLAFVVSVSRFCCGAPAAGNPMLNPGFEDIGLVPWNWVVSGGAEATGAIDAGEKHGGEYSFRISNRSEHAANVYGRLLQPVQGLKPDTAYRVTAWVKGTNVTHATLCLGPGWQVRRELPAGTYDWKPFTQEFTTGSSVSDYPIVFVTDSPADALWIDDVAVEEKSVPEAGIKVFAPSVWHGAIPASAAFYPLRAGRVEEAPVVRLRAEAGAPLEADLRMAREEGGLAFDLDVTTPPGGEGRAGESMWNSDSVQIVLDVGGGATADAVNRYFELGLARLPSGEVARYAWDGSFDWSSARTAGSKTEKGYRLRFVAPWKSLSLDPTHLSALAINVVINSVTEGKRRFVEWTPGTARRKDPAVFARLVPFDGAAPSAAFLLDQPAYEERDTVNGLFVDYAAREVPSCAFHLVVAAPNQSPSVDLKGPDLPALPAGSTRLVRVRIPGDRLKAEGRYLARVDAGPILAATPLTRLNLRTQITARLGTAQGRLAALRKQVAAAPGMAGEPYLHLGLAVAGRFLERVADPATAKLQSDAWSLLQLREFEEVLTRTERRLAAGQRSEVARPGPGLPRVENGSMTASPVGGGAARPFYFYGFGHFGAVLRDMPFLSALGATLVQQGEGPRLLEPNGVLRDGGREVAGRFERAAAAGFHVDFLTSAHLMPEWLYEQAPDARLKSAAGFVKFDIDHPLARKLIEQYLRAVVPLLKTSPALFSFCLTNEPTYSQSGTGSSRPAWAEYLKGRHPDLGELNRLYGTSHARFEDVPVPSTVAMPDGVEARRLYYDWTTFNQVHFADWHRWMNGIIKELAPAIPTSIKIMDEAFLRDRLGRGVDPELFCGITDLAGNDAHAFPVITQGYGYAWQEEEMWYDLLHSFRGQPVIDTENHLIRDNTPAVPVPPETTRCVLWQGALHHQTATTIWVWDEASVSDLAGSIYFRPLNTYAAGETMLDLNRLAPEVAAVSRQPAQVALLYSLNSLFWQEDYAAAASAAYAAVNFLGQPITFLTERELESGDRSTDNRNVRCLILPRATHVNDRTAAALAAWVRKGGKVLALGEGNLGFDEYHRPRKLEGELAAIPLVSWSGDTGSQLQAVLRTALTAAGVSDNGLRGSDGAQPWGIEYRVVRESARTLVPLTNLTTTERTVSLPLPGKAVDLLSGRPVDLRRMILPPLSPMLLEIRN